MSLLINVKENHVFFVGEVKCYMKKIRKDNVTLIVPYRGSVEYTLIQDISEEIFPNVYAYLDSVYKDQKGVDTAKICMEAPKYISVLKPDLYYKLKDWKEERKVW